MMSWKLQVRPQASRLWTYGSPVLALALTVLIGVVLCKLLGKDPVRGLQVFLPVLRRPSSPPFLGWFWPRGISWI